MSGQSKTFVSSMLEAGGYDPKTVDEDIDDAIDRWHDPTSWGNDIRSLHQFLGFSQGQYSRYVELRSTVAEILSEHGVQERA